MKQIILVSFSDDVSFLTLIHQNIPSTIDLLTLPFQRRNEVLHTSNNDLIAITTLRSNSPEGLNQLSVLKTEFPWLPVILISESPESDDIITAFKLGVDDLLLFPFDSNKIMESIRQVKKGNRSIFQSTKAYLRNQISSIWIHLTNQVHPPTKKDLLLSSNNKQTTTLAKANILPTPILDNIIQQTGDSKILSARLMGKFELNCHGRALKAKLTKKERSLLSYLLFHHDKELNKEKLMQIFWSGSSPSAARNCLNVTIHKVRRCLQKFCAEKEVIIYKDDCYAINPDLNIELDVSRFLHYWQKGRSLQHSDQESMLEYFQQAIDLYRGDFMAHMLYEEWAEIEREKIKEAYLYMLNTLCQNHFNKNQINTSILLAKRMLEKDNCLEEVHRLLINCYHIENQNDKAIRQYFKCKEILEKELDVPPSKATRALYERIKGVEQR